MEKIPVRNIRNPMPEPGFAGSFSIRRLEELLDGNPMVQELHRHDHYHILVLENGDGFHEIDFIRYDVSDYTLFFMRPGQVHQLLLKPQCSGYLIQFGRVIATEQANFRNVLRTAGNRNFYRLSPEQYQRLHPILEIMSDESLNRETGWHDAVVSAMHILLIGIVRNCQNIDSGKQNPYQQEKLDAFIELLEAHITDTRQVSDYAEMLNVSMYQLNAVTKATLNKTPSEVINAHLMLESKRRLLATANQISQIAYDLGFDDPSYFIRFFKKHCEMSPEAYRRKFA